MKQVLVVRKDLKMRKGKIAAQCAHATLAAVYNWVNDEPVIRNHPYILAWLRGSFTKVVVSVDSEEELRDTWRKCCDAYLPGSIIQDEGRTEFHGNPTYTVVAVGPGPEEDVDRITGGMKLL